MAKFNYKTIETGLIHGGIYGDHMEKGIHEIVTDTPGLECKGVHYEDQKGTYYHGKGIEPELLVFYKDTDSTFSCPEEEIEVDPGNIHENHDYDLYRNTEIFGAVVVIGKAACGHG